MPKRVLSYDSEENAGMNVPCTPSMASQRNKPASTPMDSNRAKARMNELSSPVQGSSALASSSVDYDEPPTEVATIATLLNYLSDNVEDVLKNREKMKRFEQITAEVVNNHNDPALHRVVKAHGWSGRRYLRVHQAALDTQSYLRSLANLYLSQRKAYDGLKSNVVEESTESEKIVSFLPDILVHHLTSALVIEKSGDISCSTFLGAALLVDISGFSMFAAEKCSHGVSGLNDLHDATNGFLGHLVYIVYRYGGDVVAFAGDALICVFVDQPPPTGGELDALKIELSDSMQSMADCAPSMDSCGSEASLESHQEWRTASHKSPQRPAQPSDDNTNTSVEEEMNASMSRSREISNQKAHRKAMDILRHDSGHNQSRRFSKDTSTPPDTQDNSLPHVGSVYGESDPRFETSNPSRARNGGSVDLNGTMESPAISPVIHAYQPSDIQPTRSGINLFRYGSQSSIASDGSNASPVKGHSRSIDSSSVPDGMLKSEPSFTSKSLISEPFGMLSRALSRKSFEILPRKGSDDDQSPVRSTRSTISESKASKNENNNQPGNISNDGSFLNQHRPSVLYLDKLEESQSENYSPAASSRNVIQQHRTTNPLDPDPYLQKNSCLRALECAMLLREQSAHAGTLTTHIAVSYGEMKLAILGGHNDDWVYLLNGECISELGPCLNAAGKKQVVATRRCYEQACQSRGMDLDSTTKTSQTFPTTTSADELSNYASDSMFMSSSSTASSSASSSSSSSASSSSHHINSTLDYVSTDTINMRLPSNSTATAIPSSSTIDTSSSPVKSMQPKKHTSSLLISSISDSPLNIMHGMSGNDDLAASNDPFDFAPLNIHPSAARNISKSSSSASSSQHHLYGNKKNSCNEMPSNKTESLSIDGMVSSTTTAPASVNVSLHPYASFDLGHVSASDRVPVDTVSSSSSYSLQAFSQPKSASSSCIRTTKVEEDNFLIESIDTHIIPAEHSMRLKRLLHKSPPTVVDAAKLFVSRPVLSAIYSDSLDRTAELRQVVTMFVSLDSYSPADHKDPLELQPFFKVVQEALHQSGGYLRQFVVDDKGCVVVAMWGVPQFSYSNNSLRGLFCGVAISRRSQQLQLKTSVGLTSGYCYCGCVGGSLRRDYAIIGDQVNMAARLMAKAHGKVLMDMQLRDNLPANIQHQLGRAEVMKLKGARGPVQPYVYSGFEIPVTEVLEDHEGQTTVLRRQVRLMLSAQLDKISNVSKAADLAKHSGKQSIKSYRKPNTDNHTQSQYNIVSHSVIVTVIIGLPGTGKSTAAQYFEQEARKRNIDCIKIQARPGEETRPYSVIRKLFLELIGIGNFREEYQQRGIIREVIQQAYSNASDDAKLTAELTLEIILGLDWSDAFRAQDDDQMYSYQDSSADYSLNGSYPNCQPSTYSYNDANSNNNDQGSFDPDASLPPMSIQPIYESNPQPRRKLRLKVGDLTFYNVLRALLKNRKTVIIIEDADYCDELSWNEFHLILIGSDLQLAMLLTMRTPPSSRHNRPNDSYHDPRAKANEHHHIFSKSLNLFHTTTSTVTSMYGGSQPAPTNDDHLPTVTITRASGEAVIVSIAEFDTAGSVNPDATMSKYGIKFRPNNSYLSILAHARCKVIEMNPLNEAEINELLQEALQIDEVDPELVMSVLEVTAGNAFWCKAIARFIRENGIEEYSRTIVRRGGNFNSLRALILNRIDRLSAEQQIVAKQASIIGDEFTLSVLKAILPQKIQTHLSQSLDALQHNGLVYCVEEGHEVIFSFQNQLIRNTIYDLTPPTDADQVHLNVAELLEYQYADDLRQYYPSLSYHYRNSVRNNEKKREHALKYTVKAADQAIARESYPDGLAFLQLAVPFADNIDDHRTLLEVVRTALDDLAPSRLTDLKNTLSRVRNSLVSQTSGQLDAAEMARQSIQSQYEKLQKELYRAIDKIESRADLSKTDEISDEAHSNIPYKQKKTISSRKSSTRHDWMGCMGGDAHDHGSVMPPLVNELSYVRRQSRHRRTHVGCALM